MPASRPLGARHSKAFIRQNEIRSELRDRESIREAAIVRWSVCLLALVIRQRQGAALKEIGSANGQKAARV